MLPFKPVAVYYSTHVVLETNTALAIDGVVAMNRTLDIVDLLRMIHRDEATGGTYTVDPKQAVPHCFLDYWIRATRNDELVAPGTLEIDTAPFFSSSLRPSYYVHYAGPAAEWEQSAAGVAMLAEQAPHTGTIRLQNRFLQVAYRNGPRVADFFELGVYLRMVGQ
jgi:hypothetical protein